MMETKDSDGKDDATMASDGDKHDPTSGNANEEAGDGTFVSLGTKLHTQFCPKNSSILVITCIILARPFTTALSNGIGPSIAPWP